MPDPVIVEAPPGRTERLQQLLLHETGGSACVIWHEPPQVDARERVSDRRRARQDEALVVLVPAGDSGLRRDLLAAGADEVVDQDHLDAPALAAALADASARLRARLDGRERTEQALRESEARLRRLVDTNLLGIIHWDIEGRILDANDEFLRMTGYTRTDLDAGRIDWTRMTPDDHRARDARAVEELRRAGQHEPFEKE